MPLRPPPPLLLPLPPAITSRRRLPRTAAAPDGGYQVTSGTSVTAARASGVAALLFARKGDLTPDEVRKNLYQRREWMTRGDSRIAKSLNRWALRMKGSQNDGGDCSHPERFDGHGASRSGRSREGQRSVAADVGACNGSRRG
ncbi:MAG TPA: S8 family serine peptidase [Pseudolabrys sp.]